eukprot:gene8491-315_t
MFKKSILRPILNQQKRTAIVSFTWMFKVALVSSGTIGFILYQRWNRNVANQMIYIRKALSSTPKYETPHLFCSRPNQIQKFVQYFKTSPSGSLVVVGPDGSGKSSILRKAITDSSNKLTMIVDLRKTTITTENEFMFQFVESSGYLLPNTDWFTRWLLREQEKKTRSIHSISIHFIFIGIPKIEVDKAIKSLQELLIKEKSQGWRDGIPIICIIGIEAISCIAKDFSENEDEGTMRKFFNFCVYCSDHRLCHIIIVTNYNFSHDVLDKYPAWFIRREVLDIHYTGESTILNFINNDVNPYLEMEGKLKINQNELKYLWKNIGGNLTDINTIITSIMRGDLILDAVDRLVIDSVKKVQDILESIIEEAIENETKKITLLEKYLRFWRMMKIFTQVNSISRADLIRNIFLEHPGELDEYENIQIISHWQKRLRVISHNTNDLKEEENKFEIENRVNLSSLVVVPASSRLRIAFQLILNDDRMKEQHLRAEWNLKKELLVQKKLNLVIDFNRIQSLRKDYFSEFMKVIETQHYLNKIMNEDELKNEILDLMEKWRNLNRRVKSVEKLLNDIDKVIYKN